MMLSYLDYVKNKDLLLKGVYESIQCYNPLFGAELEFYYFGDQARVESILKSSCIEIEGFERERGKQQYEIQFKKTPDPLFLATQIFNVKALLTDALFDAKPFDDDYGSAIHIHISFYDNENLFIKNPKIINNILGGLCVNAAASMIFFAPFDASYKRFVKYYDAPTHIAWGGNNRTTILRIPDSDDHNKRIEHRLAGADAEPALVIAAIIAAIHLGIRDNIEAPKRIYGNAFDAQYGLAPLPGSLAEAELLFSDSEVKGVLDSIS